MVANSHSPGPCRAPGKLWLAFLTGTNSTTADHHVPLSLQGAYRTMVGRGGLSLMLLALRLGAGTAGAEETAKIQGVGENVLSLPGPH